MPDIFIIAGPNGAGRSTYSEYVVRPLMVIFDGDKELKRLTSMYPDVDSAHLENVRDNNFESLKSNALNAGLDFGYETNFASDDPTQTARLFRANGYQINLIYIGLASVDDAAFRVNRRVAVGGHSVPADQIRSNYEEGLKNLRKHFRFFDRVMVFDNTLNKDMTPPRILLDVRKGKVIEKAARMSTWFKPIYNELSLERVRQKKAAKKHRR